MKELIKPFAVALLNIGIDPRRITSLRHLPKYISQYSRFRKLGGVITNSYVGRNAGGETIVLSYEPSPEQKVPGRPPQRLLA